MLRCRAVLQPLTTGVPAGKDDADAAESSAVREGPDVSTHSVFIVKARSTPSLSVMGHTTRGFPCAGEAVAGGQPRWGGFSIIASCGELFLFDSDFDILC